MSTTNQRRRSLNWVFTGLLVWLTVIFAAVMTLAFTRLLDMSRQFENVSQNEIPNILLYERISSEAQSLRLYTDKLAKASSLPAKQIAEAGVNLRLETIDILLQEADLDQFIYLQFDAMQNELAELSEMVSDRMRLNEKVLTLQNTLYQRYNFNRFRNKLAVQQNSLALTPWGIGQSRLFALTSQLLATTKLHELRIIKEQIEALFNQLETTLLTQLSLEQQAQVTLINKQMSELLLSESGIIKMRYHQLKVDGRTTGRANFTSKLVAIFSDTLKFQANELNTRTLAQSKITTRNTNEQIWIIGVITATAFVFLLLIVYALRRRVLLRLIRLNELVSQQSHHGVSTIAISGNDEITDIAKAVEHYSQTIKKQTQELSLLALSDGLTGIANRRAFDDELANQIQLSKRFEKSLSLALIDVDYFKPYNDNYGHTKGDETLKKVAKILQQTVHRKTDFVARYGGEEFAAVLPDTDSSGAQMIAKDLLNAVLDAKIKHEHSDVSNYLTISIGLVTCQPQHHDCEVTKMIKYADESLYKAKQEGRNRFILTSIH